MDKLVEDLLHIERTAQESLEELHAERVALSQRIAEEISHRISELECNAGKTVKTIRQDADATVKAHLFEIESQHHEKSAQLTEIFAANFVKWREEWSNYVLQRI